MIPDQCPVRTRVGERMRRINLVTSPGVEDPESIDVALPTAQEYTGWQT